MVLLRPLSVSPLRLINRENTFRGVISGMRAEMREYT